MQNAWLIPGRVFDLKPPSVTADKTSPPPPVPPDPPDSSSPLSPHLFPPLSSPSSNYSSVPITTHKGSKKSTQTAVAPLVSAENSFSSVNFSTATTACDGSTVPHSGSEKLLFLSLVHSKILRRSTLPFHPKTRLFKQTKLHLRRQSTLFPPPPLTLP